MSTIACDVGPGEDPGAKSRGAPDAEGTPAPLMPAGPKRADRRVKMALLRAVTAGLAVVAGVLGVARVVLEWALRPRC